MSNAQPGKYLTVGLGAEAYGMPVLRVREIIRMQKITPVPQMPDFGGQISADYILGLAKVKGQVKTLLDLDKVIAA